jgi:hypothetical protein
MHDVERRAGRPPPRGRAGQLLPCRRRVPRPTRDCAWKCGTLTVEFKEPFDTFAETIINAAGVEVADGTEFAKNEIWLPFVDNYRTKCIVPRYSFRLILEAVTRLRLAAWPRRPAQALRSLPGWDHGWTRRKAPPIAVFHNEINSITGDPPGRPRLRCESRNPSSSCRSACLVARAMKAQQCWQPRIKRRLRAGIGRIAWA